MNKLREIPPDFNQYAGSYKNELNRGISLSGEEIEYFAHGRVAWLAKCLDASFNPGSIIMDYGCGIGNATPFLLDLLQARHAIGIDTSTKSIEIARKIHGTERTKFLFPHEYQPRGEIDLIYCNGVFHHISCQERKTSLEFISASLKERGFFAFWENNPWNPGARLVMKKIPFDRDAIMITASTAKQLLQAAGFEICRVDYLFIFPRVLRYLRRLEPLFSQLPFGAQYQILARKHA